MENILNLIFQTDLFITINEVQLDSVVVGSHQEPSKSGFTKEIIKYVSVLNWPHQVSAFLVNWECLQGAITLVCLGIHSR